jgi:hypothetical protein
MSARRRNVRRNPTDAYAWIADIRAYTDRIRQGPVTNEDLAGQARINEVVEQVEKALYELNRALPNHRLSVLFGEVSLPLLTYTAMITLPRAQWATPAVKPIKRRKAIPNPAMLQQKRIPWASLSAEQVKRIASDARAHGDTDLYRKAVAALARRTAASRP